MTTGPRIGHFAVSYEIPGADQYEQWDGRARRRLDGAWQIGGPAAPVSTLTIKEATHG